MAIARVAKGTTLKVDTSSTAGPYNVALPAGHVSGHLLFLYVTTDDNTNTTADPAGWTRLFYITNGSSVASPYTPRVRTKCYWRIDNGSLGSTVGLTFDTSSAWPTGKPSVLAYTVAYSGCDQTGPIERWDFFSTTSTATAQAHPQETTTTANAWLLSFRAVSTDSPGATFTCSVGTDVEVQDDFDTIPELACALYDSNAALTAGVQTQRTTTASRAATYGGLAASIVIKPAAAANAAVAQAGTASVGLTAVGASARSTNGPWDLCGVGGLPTYAVAIDWAGNGTFTDPGDDITLKVISDLSIGYGRDQDRQLSPASVGNAAFSVINVDRLFSPDFNTSVLYGDLEPAQQTRAQVSYGGSTFPLFWGKIDDYTIKADLNDRTVDFTFLDGMADLQNVKLSTQVYRSIRTGDLVDVILDLAGWTGPRDLDLGATIVPYWWVEQTDALTAIQDLVKSEGPPSVAYQAPDGTFVFRDRHHRLQRSTSVNSQATFSAPLLMDCTAPAVTGAYDFTAPFTYTHGWRDIVNSVSFDVSERLEDSDLTVVWSQEDQLPIQTGQSISIEISTSDPFVEAVTPVAGTDYQTSGAGVLNVSLSRDSGQSATLTLLAVGGPVTVSSLQVRAKAISVQRNIKVTRLDADSISRHGEKAYPDQAPWANANDADAIAGMILLMYARRRPTVDLRITSEDPAHFVQVLSRTVSDRIHITYGEMGLDDDFFVEHVTHTVQRLNQAGKPPVHAVILGCEKDLTGTSNPFTFDKRGAGFDQGVFDPIQTDKADTVFTFDDPVRGVFDFGQYGT